MPCCDRDATGACALLPELQASPRASQSPQVLVIIVAPSNFAGFFVMVPVTPIASNDFAAAAVVPWVS